MYNMLCRYRVDHVHGDLTHTKYSQAFGIVECNQGPNHELISKYQFDPLSMWGHYLILLIYLCKLKYKRYDTDKGSLTRFNSFTDDITDQICVK